MRVPRVYLDALLTSGEAICLDERAHRHVAQVLKPGAPLIVFNGAGGEYAASLSDVARNTSRIVVETFLNVDRESSLQIELWQSVAKGARMDYALEKAVELGAARIRPVLTQYTVFHKGDWDRKMAHWRGVIIGACEPSGGTRLPVLEGPLPLQECVAPTDNTPHVLLDPRAEQGLRSIDKVTSGLTVLIGPEGGLSAQEIEHAQRLGFQRVRLGARTLRTETATVAALAAVQILWGDLGRG